MNLQTKDTATNIELSDEVFNYAFNEGLVHQLVVKFMNNARSGNSAQKTRAEVRGGGRKPWKQKGTGQARAGTIRSPIWRSGGVTFASKKRDYSQKINKKMYKRAMRSILSELIRQDRLIILNEFSCLTHKTKDFIFKMGQYEVSNALIVLPEISENEYLGSRNLINYDICDVTSLDPISLLKFESVVMTSEAAKSLGELLQ